MSLLTQLNDSFLSDHPQAWMYVQCVWFRNVWKHIKIGWLAERYHLKRQLILLQEMGLFLLLLLLVHHDTSIDTHCEAFAVYLRIM